MCVLASAFLPRHDRGDDNLVKALIIIFKKEFLLVLVLDIYLFTDSYLTVLLPFFIWLQLSGPAGMAGHMFRPKWPRCRAFTCTQPWVKLV